MTKKFALDLTPMENFRYNQISNHKFEYMLVNHAGKVVHSAFECKDYLQDIFWCETMKKSSSLYGLSWKPGMFDITTPFFYLALNGGSEVMNTRIKPLKKFLNAFEEKLGIEPTEIYPTESDKIIVLKFSRDWTFCGQMLSAYTTLIRVAGAYEEGDVMQYLVQVHDKEIAVPDYVEIEATRLRKNRYGEGNYYNIVKLAALYEGIRPTNTWQETESISGAHNNGITETANFPRVDFPVRVKA